MGDFPRDQAELSDGDLKEAAVSGVRWMMVARIGSDGLQFVVAIILARLISPAQFGEAAVALIFVPLSVILTYEGFGSALVQRRSIDKFHLEAATLTSVASGIALTAALYLLAPVIAEPIFGARIADLIQLVSPVFALAGLGAVPRALLSRELDFRRIGLIETASLVLGLLLSVALAITGMNADALVLGGVATTGFASAMLLVVAPPVMPRWRRRELTEITRFGVPASAAGLLYVAITNVDYAILAARLSSTQVGLYWRAFQLGVVYQDKISGIMLRLAFPIYSRTKDMDAMKSMHERATRIHGAVVVPMLAVLIVIAPELVPMLFGNAWKAAVEPAQVLAVAGMIAAVLTGYSQVMLAAGKPRPLMIFNIVLLGVYGTAVWFAAPHGLVTVATAVVGVYVLMLVTVYLVLFKAVLGIPVGRLVTDLAPAVVGSLAVLGTGFPLAELLRDLDAPRWAIVFPICLVGALVHLLVLRSFFGSVWADLFALVRRVVPSVGPFRRLAMTSSAS